MVNTSIIREIAIIIHNEPIRMANFKRLTMLSVGKDVGQPTLSSTPGAREKTHYCFGKLYSLI
jgi:hypothetical protein